MPIPDFFIAGAPKCGTTSLYEWLRLHPEICMSSPVKEPTFFGSDLVVPRSVVNSLEAYLTLFQARGAECRFGEASTSYFFSERAAKEIKEFNSAAKIILMVRNPVDLLHSMHSQQIRQGDEPIVDFADALAAEPDRIMELGRPGSPVISAVCYRRVSQLSRHVLRYLEVFGEERVHVVVLDDLRENRDRAFADILRFLEVDDSFRASNVVHNTSTRVRSPKVHQFLLRPPAPLHRAATIAVPSKLREKLFAIARSLNTAHKPRPPLSPELRRKLNIEYTSEVQRLGDLLDRDLMHWVRA